MVLSLESKRNSHRTNWNLRKEAPHKFYWDTQIRKLGQNYGSYWKNKEKEIEKAKLKAQQKGSGKN